MGDKEIGVYNCLTRVPDNICAPEQSQTSYSETDKLISRKTVKTRFPPTNLLAFNGFWPKNMLTLNIS